MKIMQSSYDLKNRCFYIFLEPVWQNSFTKRKNERGLSIFCLSTLDSGINIGVHLLIYGLFSSGYMLIKGGTFIDFFIFFIFFLLFFALAMYQKIKLSVILSGGYAYSRGYAYCFYQMFQGLRLFKGVRLFRSLEQAKNCHLT